MTAGFTQVTHPRSDSQVDVPDGWEVDADQHPDYVVAVAPPHPDGGFRSNVVLTVADNAGLSFSDWQNDTEHDLPLMLQDYLLLDQQKLEIDGHPAGRRLAHHTAPTGDAVTMQQWFCAVADRGFTLTITVADLDFAEHTEMIEEIAASWRLTPQDTNSRGSHV